MAIIEAKPEPGKVTIAETDLVEKFAEFGQSPGIEHLDRFGAFLIEIRRVFGEGLSYEGFVGENLVINSGRLVVEIDGVQYSPWLWLQKFGGFRGAFIGREFGKTYIPITALVAKFDPRV